METQRTLTVTQLNEFIKLMFDSQPLLRKVTVSGEISNFVDHRSGHFYFTLKDAGGTIRAVMFRSYAQKLKFNPENGMKVLVTGNVSVFPRDGQYQLYADNIQPDGIGSLYTAYEQLKSKLEAEGLFDQSRKHPLPKYPNKIGIITSPTGAAIRDMINVTRRRYPIAEIHIYASAVQGAEAHLQLKRSVEYFNSDACENPPDVIIIGRGGGSLEDLWAFNSEALARAIAASHIPVISAVGHETDFTICDFVSDCRAPTPSAAAELAVPDISTLQNDMFSAELLLDRLLINKVQQGRNKLDKLAQSRVICDPKKMLEQKQTRLNSTEEKLNHAAESRFTDAKAKFRELAGRISGLNPLSILSRGYTAILDKHKNIITSAGSLTPGDNVTLNFADGTAYAQIITTEVCNGKEDKI